MWYLLVILLGQVSTGVQQLGGIAVAALAAEDVLGSVAWRPAAAKHRWDKSASSLARRQCGLDAPGGALEAFNARHGCAPMYTVVDGDCALAAMCMTMGSAHIRQRRTVLRKDSRWELPGSERSSSQAVWDLSHKLTIPVLSSKTGCW